MNQSVLKEGTHYCNQAEILIGGGADVVLTTLLGSCVSTCVFDPVAGVGGINHILLPRETTLQDNRGVAVHTMELLVNPLQRAGARRDRLQAKVFGGASFQGSLGDIGARNVAFVEKFLQDDGIPILSTSTGGTQARRLRFWPGTGQVRMKLVEEIPVEAPKSKTGGGELELF